MRERPILMNGAMVRATLNGSKTQTRRIVKLSGGREIDVGELKRLAVARDPLLLAMCPCGTRGDRLWVRETWQHSNHPYGPYDSDCFVFYRADYLDDPHGADGEKSPEGRYRTWRPSIHVPRPASRILLEVTGVRVEQLQDISEADAIAEGVEPPDSEREDYDWSICPQCGGTRLYNSIGPNMGVMPDIDCMECDTHIKRYRHLWDSLKPAAGFAWADNPWVWVVEYKKVGA